MECFGPPVTLSDWFVFTSFHLICFDLFEGRNLLARGGVFTFSPTQMYCITRQLQLPHGAVEQSGKLYIIPYKVSVTPQHGGLFFLFLSILSYPKSTNNVQNTLVTWSVDFQEKYDEGNKDSYP